jgi:hypothetical protein
MEDDMTDFLLGPAAESRAQPQLPPCLRPLFSPPVPAALCGAAAARVYLNAEWPLCVVELVCATEIDWRRTVDVVLSIGEIRSAHVDRACTRVNIGMLVPDTDNITWYHVVWHESPAAHAAAHDTSADRLCMDIRTGVFDNVRAFSVHPIEVQSADASNAVVSWQQRGFQWFTILPRAAASAADVGCDVELCVYTDVPRLLRPAVWTHAGRSLRDACARIPLLALALDPAEEHAYSRLLLRAVREVINNRSPF